MSIETKNVRRDVEEHELFGWKFTSEAVITLHGRHHKTYVLSRDNKMVNYKQLEKLEKKYFDFKSKLKTYEPINKLWCFIAFLFFIIPGLIYIGFKRVQKNAIESHNNNIKQQMNEIAKQAKSLLG